MNMYCTKTFSAIGALVGFGFGIYAAIKNFDPDAHQTASMAETNRIISETLTQIGTIGLQSLALGAVSGIVGAVLDCARCCQCAMAHENAVNTVRISLQFEI